MSAPGIAVRISASIAELRAAMAAGRGEFGKLGDAAQAAAARASAAMRSLKNEFKAGFNEQIKLQQRLANGRFGSGTTAGSRTQGRDERGRFLQIGNAAKKAGADANSAMAGVGVGLRGLLGPITAVAGAFAAIKLSDDFVNLNARLKLATTSTQAASAAFTALFDVAQSRGGSLRDLGDLYIRLGLATKDAGVSQGALLRVTEAVADAVLISGGNVETANAALVQFGQGLASNRLSGDELRSILEQLPPLADAIAKGMGVTRGELRKLGEEGKLTTEKVLKAVLNQQAALEEQAKSIPITFGRAFQKLKNAALTLVEPFQGAFSAIAETINKFADFLSSDAVFGAVTAFTTEVGIVFEQLTQDAIQAFEILSDYFGKVVENIGNDLHSLFNIFSNDGDKAFNDFSAGAKKSANDAIGFYRNMPANIRAFLKIIVIEFASMFDALLALGTFFKESFAAIFSNDTINAAEQRYRNTLDRIIKDKGESVALTLDELEATKERARLAGETAREEREGRRDFAAFQRRNVKTGGGKPAALTSAQIAAARALEKAGIEAAEKLADDARKRSLSQLEVFHARKLITEEQFIDARVALELEGLDAQKAIEERRLKLGGKDAIEARAAMEIVERQRSDVVRAGEEEKFKIRKGFAEANKDLEADLLESTGFETEAAQLRLKTQFDKLIADLVAAGNTGGADIARAIFKQETFKTEFDGVKNEFDKLLASLDAREASLANQQIAGGISADLAESQLRETRDRTLEQMAVKVAALKELATQERATAEDIRAAADAEVEYRQKVIDSATGIDKAIFDLRASLKNLRANFASLTTDAAINAFADLFESLGDSTKSAGEKLRDFVRGFAQSMAQIAARALATMIVLQALETFFPGAGRLVAAGGGVASSAVGHSGGIVGKTITRRRNVPAYVFAGAPRYHGGGIAGIAPNEQATILQKGEEVVTAGDPRHANNGGGNRSVRVVNMIDQGNIHNAMAAAGGEKVILNAIRSNAGGVRQILSQG